jgi:hypothetical protein
MGNLSFAEDFVGDDHYFDLRVNGPLELVSKLIGCTSSDLGNALVTNIMVMRGETIVSAEHFGLSVSRCVADTSLICRS